MFGPVDERVEEEIDRGSVSDVCFRVAGACASESVQLYGSKAALALASPVFRTMLFAPPWCDGVPENGAWGTSSGSSAVVSAGAVDAGFAAAAAAPAAAAASEATPLRPQHRLVPIADVAAPAFRCLLRYVYRLDPQLTLDNALHVFRAADKYQIEGLKGACESYLDAKADLGDVNLVLRLFDIACRLGLDGYSDRYVQALGRLSRLQTSWLLEAAEFGSLHPASLEALLRSSDLAVDEESLWQALRCWAERRATLLSGGTESDDAVKVGAAPTWQEQLAPLRHLLRFPAMRASFFADEVSRTGVLTADETVAVFGFLVRKRGNAGDQSRWHDDEAATPSLVGGVFRPEPRVPQLAWCAAPGAADAAEEAEGTCGGVPSYLYGSSHGSLGAGVAVDTVVVDGRGLAPTSAWGSRIVLGGPGCGFQFAYGTEAFASGQHAWTISWRPLDVSSSTARQRRGGAAGIAAAASIGPSCSPGAGSSASSHPPPLAAAVAGGSSATGTGASSGGGSGGNGPSGAATSSSRASGLTSGAGGSGGGSEQLGRRFGSAGAASAAAAAAATAVQGSWAGAAPEEPSARFLDWPSCIVFGTKRDVQERRYVAWDRTDSLDGEELPLQNERRFAIAVDFSARTVTYMADRGERQWTATAPLAHEGPVYPVIAASGPHWFSIRYGIHL